MEEIEIYRKFRELVVAHTATTPQRTAQAFSTGLFFELNSDNLNKRLFESDGISYTKKKGLQSSFPLVFMLPLLSNASISRRGKLDEVVTCVFYVLDMLGRNAQGVRGGGVANRSRTEVWSDTKEIGVELLAQLQEDANNGFSLTIEGEVVIERVNDIVAGKFSGCEFTFRARLKNRCIVLPE